VNNLILAHLKFVHHTPIVAGYFALARTVSAETASRFALRPQPSHPHHITFIRTVISQVRRVIIIVNQPDASKLRHHGLGLAFLVGGIWVLFRCCSCQGILCSEALDAPSVLVVIWERQI
jgi:hypothetical protein